MLKRMSSHSWESFLHRSISHSNDPIAMDVRVRGYSADSLVDRECRGEAGGFSLGELCGDEGSSRLGFGWTTLEANGMGEWEGRGHLHGGNVVAVHVREERDKGMDLRCGEELGDEWV